MPGRWERTRQAGPPAGGSGSRSRKRGKPRPACHQGPRPSGAPAIRGPGTSALFYKEIFRGLLAGRRGARAWWMKVGSGEGVVDEGMVDEGMVDEGVVDEGVVDEGMVDEGMVDEGVVDEGVVDEGVVDEGVVRRRGG
ncbi:hypothetical protein NHX12_005628 [Muraenolepis orangiensis]|uniref:Uncharacterized protein n=1 Tax=Muraenolepis orangiensis TaxID=630683 RepID=A0A9Q0ID37_9TELE|nr:hypothetical protein NHX12_005628 [Muraenolepis orangiensis]